MEYTVKVDEDGTVKYYKPGTNILHREDGPAIIGANGYRAWLKKGMFHREDGPARVWPSGAEYWYANDVLHREDGPAVVDRNGKKAWYIEGKKLHEEDFKNRTKAAKARTFTVPVGTKEIVIQFQ